MVPTLVNDSSSRQCGPNITYTQQFIHCRKFVVENTCDGSATGAARIYERITDLIITRTQVMEAKQSVARGTYHDLQ